MSDTDPNQRVVLHGEFASFRDSTQHQLTELKRGQDRTFEILGDLRDGFRRDIQAASQKSPTNWGWVLSGVGVLSAFIALYVTPVRSAVEDLGQRLWNIETSDYSIQDGRELRDRMESRDDLIIRKIDENGQRAWAELAERSKWMGGADRDITENAHELDLLWEWRHSKADRMLDTHAEKLIDIVQRIDEVEAEQRKRTDRVYGGTP